MQNHRLSRHGFTLVELSIVLVVIGLLIGGVLIGQSLVESAENNKVINQVSQYKILIQQFHSKFKKWPGDANFFTNQNNGNNNGIIDEHQEENAKLMSHLYLTGMISEQYTAHTSWPNITINQFMQGPHEGSVYMVKELDSAIPGINTFGFGPHLSSSNTQLDEQYLNYGKYCDASGTFGRTTCSLLTPSQAAAIDGKMDDGLPNDGKVRCTDGLETGVGGLCGNGGSGSTGDLYKVATKSKVGTMMFYLRRYGQIDQ